MPDSPEPAAPKSAERAAREARLAAALRDNLRRRKEQARARAADRDTPRTAAIPGEPRRRETNPTG